MRAVLQEEAMRLIANCLVTTSLVLVTTLAAMPARAADIDVSSAIDAVTVYPDGASVTRVITVDLAPGDSTLVAKDFPATLEQSSLRVEGEAGAKLTIGAIDAMAPRAVPPVDPAEIDKRIEALKDQHDDLDGAIAAATARRKFAEHFAEDSPAGLGDKGEARPLAEWRAAFSAVGEEVANADTAVREAQRKQRAIDREVERLEADRDDKPSDKYEVHIDLAAVAATKATLRVTYTVKDARWTPLYDARLDTGTKDRKPALELVRRAEVSQSTGEDWSNVTLGVSTVRSAHRGDAPALNTLLVQYSDAPRAMSDADIRTKLSFAPSPRAPMTRALQTEAAPAPPPVQQAEEQEASADVGAFQAAFRIPGRVSVSAGDDDAKSLRIASSSITPDLVIRSVPASDPTAFLEASFVQNDDAPLLPGKVALYRDGMLIGRSTLAAAGKNENVRLGFGADDKVKIERTVVSRNEGSTGLIVSSKVDERSFKTSVRNGHDFPVKVAIVDQVPVSETSDIAVEMLPSTTPPTTTNLRDKRGVLEWAFEAKPGEAKDINLAWRVRWPKDKGVVMLPSG
jgi:uncharacterized protein (TIGR02231 family)